MVDSIDGLHEAYVLSLTSFGVFGQKLVKINSFNKFLVLQILTSFLSLKSLFINKECRYNKIFRLIVFCASNLIKSRGKANFYNFHPKSMKFCMEVTFGGIQLKSEITLKLRDAMYV